MKCWYCDKDTMDEASELGPGWFKCCDCGATWIKMLKVKSGAKKVKK